MRSSFFIILTAEPVEMKSNANRAAFQELADKGGDLQTATLHPLQFSLDRAMQNLPETQRVMPPAAGAQSWALRYRGSLQERV